MGFKMNKVGLIIVLLLVGPGVVPAARAGDILWDARRVELGQSTVARYASIPATVEKTTWGDIEKAFIAHDEIGMKQLLDAGAIVLLPDTKELLAIEIDTSAVAILTRQMQSVAKSVNGVYTACLERKLRCARQGLPAPTCEGITACQRVDYADEYTKAYGVLHPGVSPEAFWDEAVLVRVRVLDGGLAAWTKLKYLRLPTHPLNQDPNK
jgi:hypothetical protein